MKNGRDIRKAVVHSSPQALLVYCSLRGLLKVVVAASASAFRHLRALDSVHRQAYVAAAMPHGFCDQLGMSQALPQLERRRATGCLGCWRRHPLGLTGTGLLAFSDICERGRKSENRGMRRGMQGAKREKAAW